MTAFPQTRGSWSRLRAACRDYWRDRAWRRRTQRRNLSRSERFVDTVGNAMLNLCLLALVSAVVAMVLGSIEVALIFCGALFGCGVTLLLISLFERRLYG